MSKKDRKSEFGEENYFESYNDSIQDLKNKPKAVELDKLIYLVFETPDGKTLMNEFEQRFVIPSLAHRTSGNYAEELIYCEGFKDAFRFIKTCAVSHKQRIASEKSKDE